VKLVLQEPVVSSMVLKDGFWPTTRIQSSFANQIAENGKVREEFGEDEAYVRPLRHCPQPSFKVARDLQEGYFIAIWPANGNTRLVWIARALSDPNCNPRKTNCVLIQYFRPTSLNRDVQDSYIGWDSERGWRWKVDEVEPPLWEEMNALMTTWWSSVKKETVQCMIKILATEIEIINLSLISYT